jgi:hypothetical protein
MATWEHQSPPAAGAGPGSEAPNTSSHHSSDNNSRGNFERLSFGQSSVASDSADGGAGSGSEVPVGGGGRHRSISTAIVEGVSGYWDSRDLSRRPNIHRSHLSSSIQTGELFSNVEMLMGFSWDSTDKSSDGFRSCSDGQFS